MKAWCRSLAREVHGRPASGALPRLDEGDALDQLALRARAGSLATGCVPSRRGRLHPAAR